MKKAIEIYAKISCALAILVIIDALTDFLHKNNPNYPYKKDIFTQILEIAFIITLYNGIFLFAAGIYLLFQKNKLWGILSVAIPVILYTIFCLTLALIV